MTATALDKDVILALALEKRLGGDVAPWEARILRLAERTLHRWAELECGDGNDYASWSIERDETTGKPYWVTYPHSGTSTRTRYPDKEAGALKRVAALCKDKGWHFYHQTDPRGVSLYVSAEPLTDSAYNRGVAVAV